MIYKDRWTSTDENTWIRTRILGEPRDLEAGQASISVQDTELEATVFRGRPGWHGRVPGDDSIRVHAARATDCMDAVDLLLALRDERKVEPNPSISPDQWKASATRLLSNIKSQLPQLEKLLEDVDGHWCREDGIYRFYHQSFKVCYLQTATLKIVQALRALWPDRELNSWFSHIIDHGTVGARLPSDQNILGGALPNFDPSWNDDWLTHTRPIVEAFEHAHFMLEMAVKYGRELDDVGAPLPSGWAALLYLYDAR